MSKWHVLMSLPGCLPESEPTCFEDKLDAMRFAQQMQEENEEHGCADVYVVEVVTCEENCEDSIPKSAGQEVR